MFNKITETKKFYDNLITNKNSKTFFSFKNRFEQSKILSCENIKNYFDKVIKKYINKNDKVLDFGCGSGAFTYKLSKLTSNKVIGVDISKEFIRSSNTFFKRKNFNNLSFKLTDGKKLNYKNNYFDKILLIDVIHHLEFIEPIVLELKRILKKNGKIIVYEPNKLNPLIYIMHLIEKNERGLLNVGERKKYEEICRKTGLKLENFSFNGIVIGPNSKIFKLTSYLLNNDNFYFLKWLNPKIFFTISKI